MKINWVTPHFYPEIGGTEVHVEQISKQLIDRGHEVVVHTNAVAVNKKRLPFTGELGGITIKRYKPVFNRSYYFCLWKPDIREGDVVAMEGYPSLINDHVRRKYQGKFPLVIYVQGAVLVLSGLHAKMKRVYDALWGIKTLRKVDRIIAMTELEKRWCSEKGIDTNKIEIIPNGIFDEFFEEYDPSTAKQKYGLKRYILFIGRMYHEKAPIHLVQALSRVHEDYEDLGVIFIGPDQGEVAKVKASSKQLRLENKVIYAGKVSDREKLELLAGCEFFALPTLFEAQGIVFIEAWAQKKAVIGTRVGGVPYIVKDGETGLLYEYGDIDSLERHIRFLLEHPDEAMRMGRRGFEIANKEYRWKHLIDRIERLYNDAIDGFEKKL